MHIGLYVPSWPPESLASGIVTYVKWLRQELRTKGHRVTLFAGNLVGNHEDVVGMQSSVAARIARRFSRNGSDPVFDWGTRIARAAAKLHRRDPLDVFEMEESFGWCKALIELNLFPTVVKLHGPAFLTIPEKDATSLQRDRIAREGDALIRCKTLIAPSRCAIEETVSRYGLKPQLTAVIPNPLCLSQGAQLWSRAACAPATLLFVGRFDEAKGADRVLFAFKSLLTSYEHLRLIFVGPDVGLRQGDGSTARFHEYVHTLFSASERQKIEFMGTQPQSVICKLRAKATLTVVASRFETQGYTALEAMLQGCPVVASNTSGLAELIEDGRTGLLFDGDDQEELVTVVSNLIEDLGLAERLGRQAREFVAAAHDPGSVTHRTLQIYSSAIEGFATAAATR